MKEKLTTIVGMLFVRKKVLQEAEKDGRIIIAYTFTLNWFSPFAYLVLIYMMTTRLLQAFWKTLRDFWRRDPNQYIIELEKDDKTHRKEAKKRIYHNFTREREYIKIKIDE